ELISRRDGSVRNGVEYDAIASSFFEATGKKLGRPKMSQDGRIAIFVDSLNGNSHSVGQLSSGELQALGLMYLAQRLTAVGGIMVIDEPELHLHPSLQAALLDMIKGASESSQIWLSTHSPTLINAAPTESVVSIYPVDGENNQACRVLGQGQRLELLADLGVTTSSWLQHDRMVIVEGVTDKRYIELLFPVEASRSLIYVAGSRSGVDATVKTLAAGTEIIPWIAVRDRDLVGNSKVPSSGSFTWARRAFENAFLDADLLAEVVRVAGGVSTSAEIDEQMRRIAEGQRESVRELLLEEKILALVPASRPAERKNFKASVENHIEFLRGKLEVYDEGARQVDEYLSKNWDSDWKSLVQAKTLLADFLRCTPFSTMTHMMNAICRICREDERFMPPQLSELRAAISI
ncbi:ATP-dependent nuclease, partial [Streptomyces goshikiensis]|uniref:ATP-dependent nuclease n=1 Tax=Streptomyces goshikiensis TaxID=1942 RepID=UPI0036D86730